MKKAVYAKYLNSSQKKKGGMVANDKIKATQNWVQCALDIMDMQTDLMSTKDIKTKYQIMDALEVAEKRKAYMYRHKNFDGYRAGILLTAAKNSPKIVA